MSMVEPGADLGVLRHELGKLLRKRRDASRNTLDALSRKLGETEGLEGASISRSSLSRYENGDKTPPKAVVMAILKIAKTDQATTRRALRLLEQIKAAADTPVKPPPVTVDSRPDHDETPSAKSPIVTPPPVTGDSPPDRDETPSTVATPTATPLTETGDSPSDSDATPPPATPRGQQQHGRLDGHRLDRARSGQLLGQAERGEAEREHPTDGPSQPLNNSNRWLIPAAVVVVLMVVTALAIMQPWSWQAGTQDGDRGQQSATSAPKSAVRPSRACVPPATTEEVTGSPSSTADSSDSAASAEFYRGQSLVVLNDERKDSHSAALWVKIDGKLLPLFSNCYGKTGVPRKDGKIAPPKIISLPGVDRDTVVEFMACVAEDAIEVIEASCGKWTVDQPR
jgi:transcriptional regulator with XRE-family HTH domain